MFYVGAFNIYWIIFASTCRWWLQALILMRLNLTPLIQVSETSSNAQRSTSGFDFIITPKEQIFATRPEQLYMY